MSTLALCKISPGFCNPLEVVIVKSWEKLPFESRLKNQHLYLYLFLSLLNQWLKVCDLVMEYQCKWVWIKMNMMDLFVVVAFSKIVFYPRHQQDNTAVKCSRNRSCDKLNWCQITSFICLYNVGYHVILWIQTWKPFRLAIN